MITSKVQYSHSTVESVVETKKKNHTPRLVTLTDWLGVEIYQYFQMFFHLDTWGGKIPISPIPKLSEN